MTFGNFSKKYFVNFSLEKKISILLISLGVIVACFNIAMGIMKKYSFIDLVKHPSVHVILIGVIVLLLCRFFFKKAEKIMHIVILLLVAFIGIMDVYNNFYGIGQIILALILMYKYEFFVKRMKLKLFLISIFYISSIETSIKLSNSTTGGIGLEIFIYTAFFAFFLYLVYQNEIEEYIRKNKLVANNVEKLLAERIQLNSTIKRLEKERKALDERIQYSLNVGEDLDLNKFGLTKTEIKIVKILINKKKSNKDIADELCVSENTIKTHLYNIYNKIGIGTRGELIGMFNHIKID